MAGSSKNFQSYYHCLHTLQMFFKLVTGLSLLRDEYDNPHLEHKNHIQNDCRSSLLGHIT